MLKAAVQTIAILLIGAFFMMAFAAGVMGVVDTIDHFSCKQWKEHCQ